MKFHKITEVFPLMGEQELNELAEDIKKNGLKEPIWIYENKIIDGRNRYLACKKAQVKPVLRNLNGKGSLISFVISTNMQRRHLTSSQKAACALEALPFYEAEARGRIGTPKPKNSDAQNKSQLIDFYSKWGKAAQKIATDFKTNRQYIADVKKFQEKEPELFEEIRLGRKTIYEAKREQKLKKQKEHFEELKKRELLPIVDKYDVIVIDPPWPMKKIKRDVRPNQHGFDYPTMNEEELTKLNIPMEKDCHLFLWTTHKFFFMASRLIEKWKCKYVCIFTWHKPGGFQPIGLPQYNSEFAIYARHGTPKFSDTKELNTCFSAPRGKHSEKPEEFYDMLRRTTSGKRLDMFNRREIEGFDGWGFESS